MTRDGRRLVPYLRQSRKKESPISIEDQHEEIARWAERQDVELLWDGRFEERGTSGNRPWRERGLGEAIGMVEHGEADGIVVAYQSRLSRESGLGTAEVYEALDAVGARLVCVRENIDTARGGEEEFSFAINAAIARREWRRNRAAFARGKHAAFVRGGVPATPPAGMEKGRDGALRKSEHAETAARAFRVRESGGSWAEVARALRGVPTRGGYDAWSTTAARALVRNPLYKGLLRCTCGCAEERFVKELAVVPPSVWAACQERPLTDEDREARQRAGRRDPGGHLLSGILRCGGCGRGMTYHRQRDHKTGEVYGKYRCRHTERCPSRSQVSAALVEPYVARIALEEWLSDAERFVPRVDVERLAALEHARDAARAELAAFLRVGRATDPDYAEAVATRRAALGEAESALVEAQAAADREPVSPDHARRSFEEAIASDDPARRDAVRAIIREATPRVEVTRAARRGQPLEERVVVWTSYEAAASDAEDRAASKREEIDRAA